MNTRTIFAAMLLVGAVGVVDDAMAERIPAESKKSGKALNGCVRNGGTFWTQSGGGSTYGCMDKDGNGIVCGGTTAEEKKTCDTFRATPPRLPTRDEALKADPVVDDGQARGEKKGGQ